MDFELLELPYGSFSSPEVERGPSGLFTLPGFGGSGGRAPLRDGGGGGAFGAGGLGGTGGGAAGGGCEDGGAVLPGGSGNFPSSGV